MKKSKWTRAQIDMLIEKTKAGSVRMHAFEEVARQTRRKANSVRNYYYKNLAKEKTNVIPFAPVEVKQLLREIILGTSRGESVRSICLRLAREDKSKMLRFQNKYRTILRTRPEYIEEVKSALESQGYLVKSPLAAYNASRSKTIAQQKTSREKGGVRPYQQESIYPQPADIVTLPVNKDKRMTDADISNLFMGLMRLIKNQATDARVDGLKTQIEVLKAEIERLKSSAKTNTKQV